MDDLRQKLFPIFLKESERNLSVLRQFLDHEDLTRTSSDDLEAAFRAAHTLKGTANLVKAESICKIARRLEAMLERHSEARTRPTPVEHEALKLAVDWLMPLVAALQGELQEPKMFVEEALQALDLAEAFPGRTPLVELLESHSENRSPQLDDPFAGDPELLEDESLLQAELDPFAEDPGFGLEIAMAPPAGEQEPLVPDDPFGEDLDFSVTDHDELVKASTTESEAEPEESPADELPYDPFAEDSLGLEIDDVVAQSATDTAETIAIERESTADSVVPAADVGSEKTKAAEGASIEDPFAEDADFSESLSVPEEAAESDPFAATPEMVTARAEKIAESLLLPRDDEPRREYLCCVFSIGGRDYHLPIKQMKEIADLPQVLPLPLAPPMVSGLINLRGQVMPVVNVAVLNDHQKSEVRVQRRLVIAEYQNESLAFLADGVPYLSETFAGEKIDMGKFLSLYKIRGVDK